MQMNIPATFGPICFSGSIEEDCNVYGRTDGRTKEAHDSNIISVINKYMTTHDHTLTVYFVSIVLPEMSHSSIVFYSHRFYKKNLNSEY
jgi:hypothetical protein